MRRDEVYLDLFDDELYNLNRLESGEDSYEYELNIIRIHILLWLILGKTVVVPEQWAVSSKLCQTIISEISGSLFDYLKTNKITGVNPPIRIKFINRPRSPGSDFTPLELAFIERIDKGKRIRLDTAFDSEANPTATQFRSALTKNFQIESVLNNARLSKYEFANSREVLAGQLERGLNQYSGPKSLDLGTMSQISGCLLYDRLITTSGHFAPMGSLNKIGFQEYGNAISGYVKQVHNVVYSDDYIESQDDRLFSIRSMFEKADRDQTPRAAIMEMWDTISTFDQKSQRFISRLGRFCLHNAITEQFGAQYGTNGMAGGFDGDLDDFESSLQHSVRNQISLDALNREAVQVDPITLIAEKFRPNSDEENKVDTHKVNWQDIWSELWPFLYEAPWKAKRNEFAAALARFGDQENIEDFDEWDDIFDKICQTFSFIKIKRTIKEKRLVSFIVGGAAATGGAFSVGVVSVVCTIAGLGVLLYNGSKIIPEFRKSIGDGHLPVFERKIQKKMSSMRSFGGTFWRPGS